MSPKTVLKLHTLTLPWIDAAIALDQKVLGGLWTNQGYRQEIERENGICLGISTPPSELIAMGFIWIVVDEAHLISIAVSPIWQRKGIGNALLNQLLITAIHRNCHRATLEVNSKNRGAIALYRKFNFEALGKRVDYYGSGEDAIIFWLNQLQRPHMWRHLNQSFQDDCSNLSRKNIQLMSELPPRSRPQSQSWPD